MMTKIAVKICGITNLEDAVLAVRLGADALGFIFAKSPRQIPPERARAIIEKIPPFVKTIGVFVNERQAAIEEIKRFCRLDLVQLHGDEPPDFCRAFMPGTIKAFRVNAGLISQSIQAYQGKLRALLLDAYVDGVAGGTGKTFDWKLALEVKKLGIPIILSGGLGPSNIDNAIRIVKPYAVDVNSGVEERPGKKNHVLMKELMEKIHGGK
jgi:phosphoribosylanthranilate isomerase